MESSSQKLIHTFGALADLGQEIADTSDFREMVRTSLYLLLGTLAIRRGAIAEFTAAAGELSFVAVRGLEDHLPENVAISPAAGAALVEGGLGARSFSCSNPALPELEELWRLNEVNAGIRLLVPM